MRMIIVGCGRNGSGLAEVLSKMGHIVTVIDSSASAFKALGPAFRGETVEGVGFDRDILLKAKIDRTDALAAFTASDESNAVIARIATEIYHVPKVVARLYNREKAEIYRRLGVQTLSSTTWGIKRAADMLCYSPLNTVFNLGNGDVELVEIEVPLLMVGYHIRDLTVPGEVHVVAIMRGNKTFLPTTGTVLEKDDMLYIAAAASSSGRLKKLFGFTNGKGM
ncbi:MAG TPA: TrkA family potassium uptake protein [Clostridia bacterium]|nr:TrkA family potassium uptake protein [Clostridia bacterium]